MTGSPSLSARALERALAGGQLTLHFQPIVRLPDDEHEAVEALVRWRHPRLGLLLPGAFLPLAEQAGLMDAIGALVLRDAFAHLRLRALLELPALRCFVNLAPGELTAPGFSARVLAALDAGGVEPDRLGVELAPPAPEELPVAAAVARELRGAGVAVALHGVASAEDAGLLPVDVVKLDGRLVRQAGSSGAARTALRGVVGAAHARGIEVVACGVEDDAQRRIALDEGCELAEGWHFARPAPGARSAPRVALSS